MISGTEGSGAKWRDARDEALQVPRDAMLWNLAESRRDQAGQAVAGMTAAFAGASPLKHTAAHRAAAGVAGPAQPLTQVHRHGKKSTGDRS